MYIANYHGIRSLGLRTFLSAIINEKKKEANLSDSLESNKVIKFNIKRVMYIVLNLK